VAAIRFRLLGPVTTIVDGRAYSLPRAQTRGLFAYLLLNADRPVSVDAAIDALWRGAEPSTARSQIHAAIATIRRELARVGEPEAIVGAPFGYQAGIEPERVDALAFGHGLQRALADDVVGVDRADRLRKVLAGWGGPPLQDATGAFVEAERARLIGLRLTAIEELAEVDLSLGRAVEVAAHLTSLVGEQPLRERLRARLMLALYQCGRAAEALDVFRAGRTILVAELGIEPGPELQSMHERILNRDPDLTVPAVPTGQGPSRPGPRQLPAPAQLFTGRVMELAELDKIHDASTVVITAIDGMAGVGKTALAVQAAHQMIDRYPGGQLFLDLHGYTQGVAPVEPTVALEWMLRSLGVAGDGIPADLDQRAALYRSQLAEQRMVIVLDNAATEEQVQPLLPGAPGCVVLVTSRRRLAGLDQTHVLSLGTLPVADAVVLLRHSADERRMASEPAELLEELVELCGRLPLAIRIAAARLRSHPAWDLEHLVRRLRDQQRRLVELAAGRRSVIAALDLSYQDLDTDQQRTYRRLGLHPGPDIDVYAAAALLDAPLTVAGRLLDELQEAHLLQEPVASRYRFHDLTRAHAARVAAQNQTDGSLDRLLDYYVHTAAAAMDAAYPYERERRPRVPATQTPGPVLSGPALALAWLHDELANLLAAARYATEHEQPTHLLHLSTLLYRHLRTHGHYHDAEMLHQQALTTARATGHKAGELEALVRLGHTHRMQGRSEEALDHHQQALRLAVKIGHRPAELDALVGLGTVHRRQGRYGQAVDNLALALQLARAAGDRTGELEALIGLGHICVVRGAYEQATDHFGQALQLARLAGHQGAELDALTGLGYIHRLHGRHEPAADRFQETLRLARAIGSRNGEQQALNGLGWIYRMQGRYEQATEHYQMLLELAHESGNRNWQFEAWQGLGRLYHATGHFDAALTHHSRALALAIELNQPGDQARGHDGLAHAHHALGDGEAAQTHWQHALDILGRLGTDHTDGGETTASAIRAQLARRGHDGTRDGP
jgi:DNA-binding SARP family transcriptional activator/tetratricopeptide (TPR) repeat protein